MAQSNDPATLAGIPAALPPPGVVPNPEHPYSSGYILIVVGTILLTVMLLSVCIRIYTKIRIVKKSSPDDCKLMSTALRIILTDSCRYMCHRCGMFSSINIIGPILMLYRRGQWCIMSLRF